MKKALGIKKNVDKITKSKIFNVSNRVGQSIAQE
jgi:hypothetical protein